MARSVYEIKAHKELEADGYKVDFKVRPSIWAIKGYTVDYLGCFDLLAYKPNEILRFISIKGKEGVPGEHRRKVEALKFLPGIQKEIWHYIEDVRDRRTTRAIKEIIK